MARQPTVTQEQVSAAADSIKANGGHPTNRAIRDQLGVGSSTTILKFLRVWQGGQVRKSQVVEDVVDIAIIKAISNQIARCIQEATSAATSQIADLQAAIADIISENERQITELEMQAAELSLIQDQCSSYAGRVQQLELEAGRQLTELYKEREAAETARVALAKSELRLEAVPRIEIELTQVREELQSERAKAAQQHEAAAVAVARLEASEKDVRRLNEQLTVTRKAADEVTKLAAAAVDQLKVKESDVTLQAHMNAAIPNQECKKVNALNKSPAKKRGRPAKVKLS